MRLLAIVAGFLLLAACSGGSGGGGQGGSASVAAPRIDTLILLGRTDRGAAVSAAGRSDEDSDLLGYAITLPLDGTVLPADPLGGSAGAILETTLSASGSGGTTQRRVTLELPP